MTDKVPVLVDLLAGEKEALTGGVLTKGTEEIHFIARFLLLRMVSWRKNHGRFLEVPLDMILTLTFPEAKVRASAFSKPQVQSVADAEFPSSLPTSKQQCIFYHYWQGCLRSYRNLH